MILFLHAGEVSTMGLELFVGESSFEAFVMQFLYSSVVFRVQKEKTVWTKIRMGLLNTQ